MWLSALTYLYYDCWKLEPKLKKISRTEQFASLGKHVQNHNLKLEKKGREP